MFFPHSILFIAVLFLKLGVDFTKIIKHCKNWDVKIDTTMDAVTYRYPRQNENVHHRVLKITPI